MFTGSLFPIKLYLLSSVLLGGFQSSLKKWNCGCGKIHIEGILSLYFIDKILSTDILASHVARASAADMMIAFLAQNIPLSLSCSWRVNTLRPRPNCHHFTDAIFKCIFSNENVWISHKISVKVVPRVQINNIPTSVQIMAWHHPDSELSSEPMMVSLPMHICVTRPQWVDNYSTYIHEH